jgi:Tn3 transposase DDE domain
MRFAGSQYERFLVGAASLQPSRADGHQIADAILSHITPLIWKHVNPFGRYHFDEDRMNRA